MTPDWARIRQDYAEGASQRSLEKRYGVPRTTLQNRIRREGWSRTEIGPEEEVQKAEQELLCARMREARMERVAALADDLLSCLERAVKELDAVTESVREKAKKEDGGELVTDYQRLLPQEKGIIDRGGLKQLTGVLKDLKEVLVLRSDADTREQEARIAKLQRDLREQEAQSVTVLLEGACQEYAG